MKVREAMTSDVTMVTPEDTLKEAAELMAGLNVGLLPVGENDRLVGMISDRDIAIRGIGLGRGPDTKVRDIMTSQVKYCFEDQNVEEVAENMGAIQVRRLPVLDRNKRLVGIISMGDVTETAGADDTANALHEISRLGGQHTQL
jgi:CBS domain-containing protein